VPAAALQGEGAAAQPAVAAAAAEAAAPAAPPAYTPPVWAGVPEGVPYRLEVLKGGAIVEAQDVSCKDHYTFGRTPGCDFVLEHPSASRLHAVLQFNGSSKAAHVFDNASTHGTFLNKQRIKPHVHVPIRVGDTIKFGQSSRLFLLCGPDDLLPEEGLTRSQKKQLAQLEYAQRMKERDLKQSAAAMETALSSGASWGMQEDAVEEPDEDAINVDWRAMLAADKLTEKQLKQAEKIRQKEYKIKNLQTEIDRIVAKEKLEAGLTPGQVSTLARNEQAMEALRDELEDLEEALVDSVKDAVTDRNRDKIQAAKSSARRRKRGTTASDEEYLEGSDSDDDFYDRTTSGKAAAGAKKARLATTEKEQPQVESAQSLYGKREALQEAVQQLTEEVAKEERALAQQAKAKAGPTQHGPFQGSTGPPSGSTAPTAPTGPSQNSPPQKSTGPPPGSSIQGDGEEGAQAERRGSGAKASPSGREAIPEADGGGGGADAASRRPADTAAASSQPAGEKEGAGTATGSQPPGDKLAGAAATAADDSLDAFMSSMAVQLDDEKLRRLKRSLEDTQLQLARTERLLKIADPDGWLKPNSKAAQAAKVAAQEALEAERKRHEAAAVMAAKKRKEAQAAGFVEEVEEEEEEGQPSSSGRDTRLTGQPPAPAPKPGSIGLKKPVVLKANPKPAQKASAYNPHRLEVEAPEHWGLQVRKPPGSVAVAAAAAAGGGSGDAAGRGPTASSSGAAATAAKMMAEFSGGATDRELAANSSKAKKGGGAGFSGGSMYKKAVEAKANEEAAAKVAADLQVLEAADRRKRELEELAAQEKAEEEAAAAFVASKEAAAKEAELRQRLGY